MNAAKRLVLIGALLAATATLLMYASFFEYAAEAVLTRLLGEGLLRSQLPVLLGRVGWFGMELLPWLVWRNLRDVGMLRLRWSWTLLLPLVAIGLELVGLRGWPARQVSAHLQLTFWGTLLIGANEEIVFRGYAFHRHPERYPRLLIVGTSAAFALAHYVNLTHDTPQSVTVQVGFAFVIGLGLGIVRLTTGSLGWCILLHGLIDMAADLGGMSPAKVAAGAIALPSLFIVTVLVLRRHPALQPVPAGARPGSPATQIPPARLARLARKAVGVLLGIIGGIVAVLAVIYPRFLPSDRNEVGLGRLLLAGWVILPCWLLAGGALRRRRSVPSAVPVSSCAWVEAEAASPDRQAVKIAAVVLMFVTVFVFLNLVSFSFTGKVTHLLADWTASWAQARAHWSDLGIVAGVLITPPLLLAFYLTVALRPVSTRRMVAGWMVSAVYYGLLLLLTSTRVHWSINWLGLHVQMWGAAGFGLMVSLYLLVRRRMLPPRFDWMFPVAVAYPFALLVGSTLGTLLDPYLQTWFPGEAFANFSGELTDALLGAALLVVILLPRLAWRQLRDIGSLRPRGSWTVWLLLPAAGLNLMFFTAWPVDESWTKTDCLLASGLLTGWTEELVFRGYLFHGKPRRRPRFVILASAVFFACNDLTPLADTPWQEVLLQVGLSFSLGLCLGIVRLVTGSLLWGLLCCGAVEAANNFADVTPRYHPAALGVITFVAVAGVLVLWKHPMMRVNSFGSQPASPGATGGLRS